MYFIVIRSRNLLRPAVSYAGYQNTSGYSTDFQTLKKVSLTDLKRGTGGRSSFNGLVATVFGASGFLGRYVTNKLGKIGTQIIVPYRGDACDILRLKLTGDLGQVLFQPYSLLDEASIIKCIKHSNVVINLVGRDWESKNFSFDKVHVEGARRLARLSKQHGVETFLHVSSLNATPSPQPFMLKGGSKWLASKWEGEQAVREEFPEAIIFRPSDIYGQEDRFLNYYCSLWRHHMKWMPLYKKGEETQKQPVFVSDVAAGIVAAVKDRSCRGKIYQAVGPNRYLLSELVDWFHRVIKKSHDWGYFRYDLRYDPIYQAKISLMPLMTLGNPFGNVHWERVEREAYSDIINKRIGTLEDLGIVLTRMEDQVPWEVKIYTAQVYALKELMEFDVVEPPQTVPI